MQEMQINLDTKANSVEFEILDHAKAGVEDFEKLSNRIGIFISISPVFYRENRAIYGKRD